MVAGHEGGRHQGEQLMEPRAALLSRRAYSRTMTACSACARAMPIDTAVAATSSDSASASVAKSSTPARRRLANVFSEIGEVKPAIPVSSVIAVVLRESVLCCCKIAPDLGDAVEE